MFVAEHPNCVKGFNKRKVYIMKPTVVDTSEFVDQDKLQKVIFAAEKCGLYPIRRSVLVKGNKYDRDIGWWYGAFISDGWADKRYVGYTKLHPVKRREFVRIAREKICNNFALYQYRDDGASGQKLGESCKVHLNGVELATSILCCYHPDRERADPEQRGALFKIIPDELLNNGSRECLLGLLAGLLEGDGTLGWNTVYKKRRFVAQYCTSSKYMLKSIEELGMLLNIRIGVTVTPPRGHSKTSYTVCFSKPDLWPLGSELEFMTDECTSLWTAFTTMPEPRDHTDRIPVSNTEAAWLQGYWPTRSKEYGIASEAKRRGLVTRKSAKRLLEGVGEQFCTNLRYAVQAEDILWIKQ